MADKGRRPEKPPVLVSACLVGVPCNHRGEANSSPAVAALAETNRLIPVCPEVMGGLATPRPEAELQPDGRVMSIDGTDLTDAYRRGAAKAAAVARASGATAAVLKARSPSCGCNGVYDGKFTRTVVPGQGVTAQALAEAGLTLRSEEDIGGMMPSG